jgi:hypothetical protein
VVVEEELIESITGDAQTGSRIVTVTTLEELQ